MTDLTNRVIRYSLIAAFGGFVFGIDAANISGGVRYIQSLFELSATQIGLVVSCAIAGVIFSLLFAGTLAETYGRKKVLLGIATAYLLSSLISALAPSFEMLVLGRFIGGVAFASLTISAMYIGEIAPAETRGKFVSINQLLITLGSLLAFIVNYFFVKLIGNSDWVTEENVWRFMLGFEVVPNIIWISLLLTIPESPRWLIKKSREVEAEAVFARFVPRAHIASLVASIKNSLSSNQQTSTYHQLRELFSRKMFMVLLIAICYAIVQGGTGMNAVLFYAPTVFEQVGMSTQSTMMQTIVLGSVAVTFTLVSIVFVDKLGRRALTLAGLSLVVVAHLSSWYGFKTATYKIDAAAIVKMQEQNIDVDKVEGFLDKTYVNDVALKADLSSVYSKKELPLVTGPIINATISIDAVFVLTGIFLFLAAFNMSIGPIMWVIFSEIFPNRVRSIALPFAALIQSVSAVTIQQFFPWQLENVGSANTFLTYAVVGFVGLLIMMKILPETKNKSIEDIENKLVAR